jgi:hypothetical protein
MKKEMKGHEKARKRRAVSNEKSLEGDLKGGS